MNDSSRPDQDELDREAIRMVRSGDSAAFSGLVDSYSRQIYTLAIKLLSSPEAAEEAVQDIFLKAWQNLPRYDFRRRFFPWLYTIAINHLRSMLRRTRRETLRDAQLIAREITDPGSPLALVERGSVLELVERALRDLPAPQREAFVLRHVRGLSSTDAAAALGVPENTLKTRLRRAREALQVSLTQYGVTADDR